MIGHLRARVILRRRAQPPLETASCLDARVASTSRTKTPEASTRRRETPPQVREVIKNPIPAISLGHQAASKSFKTQLVVRRVNKGRYLALLGPMFQNLLADGLLRQVENPTL